MGIEYLGSWDGPGEIPKCTYTEGLNRVCHFNTSPNPTRTAIRKEYSAICLECADTHPGGSERCLKRMAKGDCANRKAIQEKCALTCGICAADNAKIVDNHLDFVWAKHAKELVYDYVLEFLSQ